MTTKAETPEARMRESVEALSHPAYEWSGTSPVVSIADAVKVALAAERAAIERCAAIADELGGDRVKPRLRDDPTDKEGRTGALINAQHVRAQTIATAIRSLIPGEPA